MVIKILGTGCRNCVRLEKNAEVAVKDLGIDAEVVKETDMEKIVEYGIMSTPALVVDEKVLSSGKVLKPDEIVRLIKGTNH
ncbi:thioredoxin family protein [Fervidibacillus halotolerans]|uniref:Thioredoxin family protein n=1 Tax=Fervidibacillus halotolerans TaxID=2980027 RepID=A0A9E8M117_9BACI|nr:thioredoxin family protein [Fervidibacillus halotolerans]WAA12982.1 thioredoxin family protein [Fervidibacillus halotolerans]